MNLEEVYNAISDKGKSNIKSTFELENINHFSYSDKISDLSRKLKKTIEDQRLHVIKDEVIFDINNSLIRAYMGYYREAHKELRSSLELAYILFRFTNDYFSFMLWSNGIVDMSFSKLNTGVESIYKYIEIVRGSNGGISDGYSRNASKIYRNCSEYVHGKYEFMQQIQSPRLEFSEDNFKSFMCLFTETIDIIEYIFDIQGEVVTNE